MKKKICVVLANYYPQISKMMLVGASKVIKKNNFKINKKIYVSGVFEIPVAIARNINRYDAFLALGCVIKGKTPHFEFIANSTINAIMNLSITYKKPIGNGIITCLNKDQAIARSNKKGIEAADAILKVLHIL